jgi:hypothetical protein
MPFWCVFCQVSGGKVGKWSFLIRDTNISHAAFEGHDLLCHMVRLERSALSGVVIQTFSKKRQSDLAITLLAANTAESSRNP